MKNRFTILLLSLSFLAQSQAPDTAAVRSEVNDLIAQNRSLVGKQKFDEAFQVIQQAEEKCQEAFGTENGLYAKVIFNNGRTHFFAGAYADAESNYLKAKEIQERTIGKNHADYAWTLNNLGTLYNKIGRYQKAEKMHLEAIKIRKIILGKKHPDYASSLDNLGLIYKDLGQFQKAEGMYLEAKTIRQKALGKEDMAYTTSLFNLAGLYRQMGLYEKAKALYLETLEIDEKVLGKEHPYYAEDLRALGELHRILGQYEKAESLLREAKAIIEKVFEKEHPENISLLSDLGVLYKSLGQYKKAESLLLEAKAIEEKGLSKESTQFAAILSHLATLYEILGQYKKAESLLLEAKAIDERIFGKKHFHYAEDLGGLGNIYRFLGKYEKAEQVYKEALNIQEKTLGKGHLDYGKSIFNLADLYQDRREFKKAEALLLEVKKLDEIALGKQHLYYIDDLFYLANCYIHLGNDQKASPLFLEANEKTKDQLLQSSRYLSERELMAYANKFKDDQNQFLSFAQDRKNLWANLYDNSLFYKGFLLNSSQQLSRVARTDSLSLELYYQLKGFHRRLAAEYSKPMSERERVTELEEKANSAEKALTRRVAAVGDALRQVHWNEVQAQLRTEEAAIEFVHYTRDSSQQNEGTWYAALLIRPGDEQPQFISLFEEAQLRQLTSGNTQNEKISNTYAMRGVTPSKASSLKGLYELLWKPIESSLTQVKTVYYSPTGLLHQINFDAISSNKTECLADHFQLIRLGSTRSLVVKDKTPSRSNQAILFGGIQYDMDSTSMMEANPAFHPEDALASRGIATPTDERIRGNTWSYLKGTKEEVESIHQLLEANEVQATVFSGYAASEEAFKAIGVEAPAPRFLHIATHGFFFPDPKKQAAQSQREVVFKSSDNPMIRSGLLLAGSNHAWQGNSPLANLQDGILTAYEISQMDLSNTELVVLSACETGLGDIKGNEGVYGLQRAFKIAGAKYLIMSLWQVPDQETAYFMETFYRHLIDEQMSIPEAFRSTQADFRKNPASKLHQWAGFVLIE